MTHEPLVLAPAEMAVIFQHLLGPAAGQATGLFGDLNLAPDSLATARARLLERGLLRPAPDRASRATFIAPHVRPLLGAATRPLMLAILQVMRPGQPERGAYFSWTPDLLVYNTTDAQGNHRLEALPSIDAVADRALAECGLLEFKPARAGNLGGEHGLPPAGAGATSPDAVAQAATLRVVFMTVASARTAHEQVRGLVWLVSQGQLYLLTPLATGDNGGQAKSGSVAGPKPRAGGTLGARTAQARAQTIPANGGAIGGDIGATDRGLGSTGPVGTGPMSGGVRTPDANLRPLPLADLRAALLTATHQAIDHTQAVLAAA